jgi:hypothetical protein
VYVSAKKYGLRGDGYYEKENLQNLYHNNNGMPARIIIPDSFCRAPAASGGRDTHTDNERM